MSSPPWWLVLNLRRGAALYARTAFPALADGERLVDAGAERAGLRAAGGAAAGARAGEARRALLFGAARSRAGAAAGALRPREGEPERDAAALLALLPITASCSSASDSSR